MQFFEHNASTASSPLIEWDAFKAYIRGICIKTSTGVCATLRSQLDKDELELHRLELLAVMDIPACTLLTQQRREHSDIFTHLVQHDYKVYATTRQQKVTRRDDC